MVNIKNNIKNGEVLPILDEAFPTSPACVPKCTAPGVLRKGRHTWTHVHIKGKMVLVVKTLEGNQKIHSKTYPLG